MLTANSQRGMSTSGRRDAPLAVRLMVISEELESTAQVTTNKGKPLEALTRKATRHAST
jgi:hypothetical protein